MTRILRARRPRGRHRLEHQYRRPVGYAAAGVIALCGAVAVPLALSAPGGEPAVIAPLRPLAATPSVRPTAPPRASRATRSARPAHLRWTTRTVRGRPLHGRATWYGPGFHGRTTASGEEFDSYGALTAAHRTLPFGTRLEVCYRERCVVVRINDRGPYGDAILDLSWLAASRIGLDRPGIAYVTATPLHTQRVRVRS